MIEKFTKLTNFLNKNDKILIICFTSLIGILLITNSYLNRNESRNIISTTGLGKKNFTSDLIVWSGSFSKVNINLKLAYKLLKKDEIIIINFLKKHQIKENEIIISATKINKKYETIRDKDNNYIQKFVGYNLSKQIKIESKDVIKIENLSRKITEIINKGVEFNSYKPQYFYTKLAELKIKMIAEATEDARKRAETIAEKSKSSLGKLKFSRMGVFQIIGQNSNENFSSGGTYNTSSKKKTALITMKLKYQID